MTDYHQIISLLMTVGGVIAPFALLGGGLWYYAAYKQNNKERAKSKGHPTDDEFNSW